MVRLLASLLLIAGCATAPRTVSTVPGCDVLAQIASCTAAASSNDATLRCYADAQLAADRVLEEQVSRIGGSDATSVAGTQPAWIAFRDADCDAVALHESSDTAKAACRFGHTLRRAQALWSLYLDGGKTGVPCDCRP